MAQVSAREQVMLRAQGLYAREKCDREGCGQPIGSIAWNGRNGEVYCSMACKTACEGSRKREYRKREGVAVVPVEGPERGHARGQFVSGFDAIEQAVIVRMQKEPRAKWQAGEIISLLKQQNVAHPRDIRQAIWNLQATGRMSKQGRVLVLSKNGHVSDTQAAKGMQPSASQREQPHVKRAKIRVQDVPYEG